MKMLLKRIAQGDDGTFGVLINSYYPFALTLEDAWHDNKSNISCIPTGKYKCIRKNSPHHGEVFEVLAVEGRFNILFHRGNSTEDTEGCILIGEQFEVINGKQMILHSGNGFDEFMRILKGYNEFDLEIVNA